jgi:tetratricopeptide (TPR) repeat protein
MHLLLIQRKKMPSYLKKHPPILPSPPPPTVYWIPFEQQVFKLNLGIEASKTRGMLTHLLHLTQYAAKGNEFLLLRKCWNGSCGRDFKRDHTNHSITFALVKNGVSQMAVPHSNIEEAIERWNHCLQLAGEEQDMIGQAKAFSNIGCAYRKIGKLVEAKQHLDKAWNLTTS